MSEAEALRQRSDSVGAVPLQTGAVPSADTAPPDLRGYVPPPRDGVDAAQESKRSGASPGR